MTEEVVSLPAQEPTQTVPEQPAQEVINTPEIKALPSLLTAEAKIEEPKVEIKEDKTAVEPEIKTESKDEIKTETKDEGKTAEKETEGSKSDEPAPLPTYEEFKAPEGITLDAEQIGDFTKALAEFESKTKADHAEVQALGQGLIERHSAEVKKSIEGYTTSLLDAFEKQKNDWRESFEKDPEIGGNRKDTTVNAALEFIKTHGGTEEQKQEIHQLMDQTGVGNHPAILRLFAKAMNTMSEGKPLPATRPVIQKSKLEKFYGATT